MKVKLKIISHFSKLFIGNLRTFKLFSLLIIGLYFVFSLSSCSNTKFLKQDEKLYIRTWFKWKGEKKVERLPYKAYDVFSTGFVRSNWNYFTFSRSGLTFYNYLQPSKTWGLKHYFWAVLSKPPVLLSDVNTDMRLIKMQQVLFNQGHFDSKISLKLKYKGKDKKKVVATYTVNMKPSYHYRNFNYFASNTEMDKLILRDLPNSLIKSGDEYWLMKIKNERQRITDMLRNKGYFFFKPDYLIFDIDTTIGNRQIDAALRIKPNVQDFKKQKYSVGNVRVFFNVNQDSIASINLEYDTLTNTYFQVQNYFKQKYINRNISLKNDSLFNLDNHNNTISYINGYGVFKQTELVYSIDTTKKNSLNANLFLSNIKPVSIGLEMNFATKSNDFLGPSAVLSLSHANIFHGGEKLSLQIDGGIEWQKASKRKDYELGFNSFDIGVKTILDFPRFLLPFKLKKQSKKYIPRTYSILGYKMIKRVKYYQMSLSHANFGYKWKADNGVKWKIEPLTLNYITMVGKSQEFSDYLNDYPSVARSFDEQFILGSTYMMTIEKKSKKSMFKNYYNNITVDLAGNTLHLLSPNRTTNTSNPDEFLDVTYSQYFKITNDFRHYLQISPVKQLVTRLLIGLGVPYNNSEVLPYIKQYYAGGSSDIRAFYARTVGPGSYKKDYDKSGILLDQSGEIKIVGNIEYRFPLTYKLDGALFLDAGNVWLLNADTSRVGGEFHFNSFINQIAMGGGFGLRINLDYIVIRLDAALPFRRPYKEGNSNWTFTDPHLFKDYILSFAIGYPF